jgi:two-component sensor histidine kinase
LFAKYRHLSRLSPAVLQPLAAACAVRPAEAGQDLFRQDDPMPHLHFVLDGWVARYRELDDGRRQFPAILIPGDVCDLDRLKLSTVEFGAVALSPCTIGRVPLDEARRLAEQSAPLRDAFWRMTCIENAVAYQWAVSLGCRSARERLAHLFCELACRVGALTSDGPFSIPLPMTQEELGSAVGLSAVHVNRCLQQLRSERLVEVSNRTVRVLDWAGLVHAGNFDPAYLHIDDLDKDPSSATSGAERVSSKDEGIGRPLDSERALTPAAAEMQELNHRIANSLQIAVSLLHRGRRRVADPAALEALDGAAARLEAVGKVHRYLYAHKDKASVDLKAFVEGLCPDLARSTGLGCEIEADAAQIDGATAQQLAILINELAINAAKHGYADGESGTLRVGCLARDGMLTLTVADDGHGLAEDFDLHATKGLGMSVVRGITESLKGRLYAANDGGARFTVELPLAPGQG